MGKTIRKIRKANQPTQAVVARRAGLTREYVNKIETGQCDTPLNTINALAKAPGVRPAQLLA